MASAVADIFISYASSDKAWAFWLGKELEALGHVPHIHEWEIAAGSNIYAWIERTHHGADHVLCVVSDDYLDHLKAPYSALERNTALWQAASMRPPPFALFVVVKPCKLPTLTDHLRRCEVHDVPAWFDARHSSVDTGFEAPGSPSPSPALTLRLKRAFLLPLAGEGMCALRPRPLNFRHVAVRRHRKPGVSERAAGTARSRPPSTLAQLEVDVRRLWQGPVSGLVDLRRHPHAARGKVDKPQTNG